jgi:glycosyltransferase involved in cell wall biosynthesis
MRILFVASNIECPGTNGGSTHVTEVVRHLREKDEVLLIARRGSTLECSLAIGRKAPIGLRQLNAARLFAMAYPAVRAFRPDVIYERASAFGLGAMLGRALSVPTLCMVLDAHQTALSLATATRLIATCPELVPPRHRHKLRLVNWGANPRSFHPSVSGDAVRRELGVEAGTRIVGYAGAFYSWHGLEELVEAARQLGDLDVRFLLVGEGERFASVRRLVARAGLQARFVFTGRVPYERVPEYIAACDVSAAPYNPARHKKYGHTGHFIYDPLKLFEAMASGKPVVTLRASNIEAMFENGRELVMVPPGDASSLASALRALLTDPAQRARIGAAARQIIEQRYSWAAHTNQLRELFREMVQAPDSGEPELGATPG